MTEPTYISEDGTVRGYTSLDAMLADMARATDQANAHLADEQRALTFGDYWVNCDTLIRLGFPVFGHVVPLEEAVAKEASYYSSDEDAQSEGFASVEDMKRHKREFWKANLERGYMFGPGYSVAEPEGEFGDTHRAHVWPISKEAFEAARAAKWDAASLNGLDVLVAFSSWCTHRLRETVEPSA
jgi:hypothetical protein